MQYLHVVNKHDYHGGIYTAIRQVLVVFSLPTKGVRNTCLLSASVLCEPYIPPPSLSSHFLSPSKSYSQWLRFQEINTRSLSPCLAKSTDVFLSTESTFTFTFNSPSPPPSPNPKTFEGLHVHTQINVFIFFLRRSTTVRFFSKKLGNVGFLW